MTRILDNKVFQWAIATGICISALMCIFTPDLFILKQGANFAVQFMFLYLAAGLLFFALDKKKLMLVSLTACGFMALFLKNASDQSIRYSLRNTNPDISVAHIDLSLSSDFSETMYTIWRADVDVISFQEYTPDWDVYLTDQLARHYPYRNTLTRIDPYGMAVYSKYPIGEIDTLVFGDIPALHANISLNDGANVHLISAHSVAPVNEAAYQVIRSHFATISDYIARFTEPVIALGDFSLPSWSDEIKEFKRMASLLDSRRDIIARPTTKPVFALSIPIDHIFYSQDIECTGFRSMNSRTANHIGVTGSYQLKTYNTDSGD